MDLSHIACEMDAETKEGWIALEVLRVLGYENPVQVFQMGSILDLPNKSNLQFDWQNNDNQMVYFHIDGTAYYVISYNTFEGDTYWKVYDMWGNSKELWQFD